MKIQFAEKGEVPSDFLLDTVQPDYPEPQDSVPSPLCSRTRKKCCSSWMSILVLVGVVATQVWALYCLYTWSSAHTYAEHVVSTDDSGNLRFAWHSCGSQSDPFKLHRMQVSPDPIHLEGSIRVNLNATLDVDVDGPISVSVKVGRHFLWWWMTISSHHYSDICNLYPSIYSCPFPKGQYVVKDEAFDLRLDIGIPGWLVKGHYYVYGAAYKNDKRLGCYIIYTTAMK